MRRALLLLTLFMASLYAEVNETSIRAFISGSIIAENAHHFGVVNLLDLEKVTIGEAFPLFELTKEVVEKYPASNLTESSDYLFVPIFIKEEPTFLVKIDKKTGEAISLGYRNLALEMVKIQKRFGTKAITLYSSIAAQSYLFSVPTRSSNLTLLTPNWEKQRALLKEESATMDYLKSLATKERN